MGRIIGKLFGDSMITAIRNNFLRGVCMGKKKKYGNPVKEKAYREALKKAKRSKVLNASPSFSIGKASPSDVIGFVDGIPMVARNEVVYEGIDTSLKFHKTMKDILGKYEFVMSACDSNHVYVTVEGTPYKHHKMEKKRAYWEWDMVWKKEGTPKILSSAA